MAKTQSVRAVKSIFITGTGSFLNLFKPRAVQEGQTPRYSAAILIPKEDKDQVRSIKALISEVAGEAFGPGWEKQLKAGKFKYPLQDGDTKAEEDEKYASYRKHWYVNASNERPIGVVNKMRQPIADVSECYSGCTIQALVNFFSFTTMGDGVGTSLQSVRVIHKGKRLDGSVEATDVEWPEVAGEYDADEEQAEAGDKDVDEDDL